MRDDGPNYGGETVSSTVDAFFLVTGKHGSIIVDSIGGLVGSWPW